MTSEPSSRAEHESYDVWSLRRLEGSDRLEAERILLEVLHSNKPDLRAIEALSVLGTATALDALEEALSGLLARGHVGAAIVTADILNEKNRISKTDAVTVATAAMAQGVIHHQTYAARLLVRVGGESAWRLFLDVIATMPLAFVRADLYEHCLDALRVEQKDRDLPSNLATLGQLIGGQSVVARDAGLAEFEPIALNLSKGLKGAKAGVRRGKGKRAARAAREALRRGNAADLDALSDSGREYLGAWVLGHLPTEVYGYYPALEVLRPSLMGPVLEELASWPDEELGDNRSLVASALEALHGAGQQPPA